MRREKFSEILKAAEESDVKFLLTNLNTETSLKTLHDYFSKFGVIAAIYLGSQSFNIFAEITFEKLKDKNSLLSFHH